MPYITDEMLLFKLRKDVCSCRKYKSKKCTAEKIYRQEQCSTCMVKTMQSKDRIFVYCEREWLALHCCQNKTLYGPRDECSSCDDAVVLEDPETTYAVLSCQHPYCNGKTCEYTSRWPIEGTYLCNNSQCDDQSMHMGLEMGFHWHHNDKESFVNAARFEIHPAMESLSPEDIDMFYSQEYRVSIKGSGVDNRRRVFFPKLEKQWHCFMDRKAQRLREKHQAEVETASSVDDNDDDERLGELGLDNF